MTPPVLYELLHDFDDFFKEHLWLMETDPEEFYHRMERFICFVVCRSHREGVRLVMKNVTKSSKN